MDHTDTTISQNYYWTNLRDRIRTHIKVCRNFQNNKKQSLKYGLLPAKEAKAITWDISLVDLISPYEIEEKVMMTQ